MSILRPPITEKTALIEALEDATDIANIQVFEDIIDGSQITSYVRCYGDFGNVRHSVVVLSKKQKLKKGS
jgi:hypothetical protein